MHGAVRRRAWPCRQCSYSVEMPYRHTRGLRGQADSDDDIDWPPMRGGLATLHVSASGYVLGAGDPHGALPLAMTMSSPGLSNVGAPSTCAPAQSHSAFPRDDAPPAWGSPEDDVAAADHSYAGAVREAVENMCGSSSASSSSSTDSDSPSSTSTATYSSSSSDNAAVNGHPADPHGR